ncbi:MAG: hypothetical protein LUH19_03130, partial [Lachnospiraceae bacterium]|nr:hypothetical protein [Lachnospiraceae bacterium]
MLRRLEYLLFVICVILAALFAPRFLFAIQDRANNQTVYAEYREINVSSVLVSNYIENDAERYITYLYHKSQGTEYEVMELDGSLSNGEILVLLQEALTPEFLGYTDSYGYGFEMYDGDVVNLTSTQYAIYDAQDHSDIMFLATLITITLDSGRVKFSDDGNLTYYDVIKVLVDSQTGALYFIGFYYLYNPFEDTNIFSSSPYEAVKAYDDLLYERVPDMESHSCAELWTLSVSPYLVDDWMVEEAYHVELEEDAKYTDVSELADFNQEDGFVTRVETNSFIGGGEYVTFQVGFAVKSPEEVPPANESSYV